MPELPEVQTTVEGLKGVLPGKTITAVWSDLPRHDYPREEIKNEKYFKYFKKNVTGEKITKVSRRGKNILIHLANKKTILVHMKMTGHLLYGKYAYDKKSNTWYAKEEGPLQDPYNRFIHLVFSLSPGKELAFSDARKFGKVVVMDDYENSPHLSHIGPEPLLDSFTYEEFKEVLQRKPSGKIKQVLMDQAVIAGIGNIYSDEILWCAGVHPESISKNIPEAKLKVMFKAMKNILKKGVDFGGDSTSDYRNIKGEPGSFHYHHKAYRQTGEMCGKRSCSGGILRKVVGGRSAHFCSHHQTLY